MNDLRQNAIDKLAAAGVRPSGPRIVIMEYLLANRIHPGAEEIYKKLLPDNPTLSLSTVYNTLKLFAQSDIVQILTIESGELRYDICTDFHAHFKCRCCEKVSDLFIEKPAVCVPEEFAVERFCMDFYGVCPSCAKNK